MLWLEMNLATSVCLLALFSPLTFHVRMLFIVIDRVSFQRFDWKFWCSGFLPDNVIWFNHKCSKGVGCCDTVVMLFYRVPCSRWGSAGVSFFHVTWILGPYVFLAWGFLFHYILFPDHQLESILVFSRSVVFFGALSFPLSPLHSCSLWPILLHWCTWSVSIHRPLAV